MGELDQLIDQSKELLRLLGADFTARLGRGCLGWRSGDRRLGEGHCRR